MNDYQHLLIHRNQEAEHARQHQRRLATRKAQPKISRKPGVRFTRLILRVRRGVAKRAPFKPQKSRPLPTPRWGIE